MWADVQLKEGGKAWCICAIHGVGDIRPAFADLYARVSDRQTVDRRGVIWRGHKVFECPFEVYSRKHKPEDNSTEYGSMGCGI